MSTDAGTIRTAFDGVQRRLGAEFMEWENWYWPTEFGDAVAEHNAVRQDVGVWDESPLRKWDFTGPDALAAADRIFTNDMLGLEIGQVRYAPFCDENGKMVGDGTVFKFTDSSAWVITALDSDLDHMRDVVDGLDVAIEPITEKLPHLQLQGPRSRDLLAGLVDEEVEALGYFRFLPHQVHVGRVPAWVSRTGYSGELGYEIFTEPDYAEELWGVLTEAGAKPYGLSAVETLRIESGLIFEQLVGHGGVQLALRAGGAGELGGLVDQRVQLRVLLEVRRLEVVGPQHPEVVLDELGALLLDEHGSGAEVGVVVVGQLADDPLDRLGLDPRLGGVVHAAGQVAVGRDLDGGGE